MKLIKVRKLSAKCSQHFHHYLDRHGVLGNSDVLSGLLPLLPPPPVLLLLDPTTRDFEAERDLPLPLVAGAEAADAAEEDEDE